MASRHHIPTIFTLSMVDVLCCALGCVILLWLVNLYQVNLQAVTASQTSDQMLSVQKQRDDLQKQLIASAQKTRETELARDQTGRELTASRARVADLDKSIKSSQALYTAAQDRLAKKNKDNDRLAKDLVAARQRASALDLLVREKETMASAAAKNADDVSERLRDADARIKQLRAQADLLPGLREEAKNVRDKMAAGDARLQALERDVQDRDRSLAGSNRLINSLQDERKTLTDQVARVRAAAENRFAGIELSGRRVVFLVDMSGSMELVDENTAAPEKWTAVRQTLARVMRSLPDLEKFQVILFSTKATYLLGNEDRWIDYDLVTSTSRVAQAMAAVKPAGNTDMYTAFDSAFRYRYQGLDTIYVLSDGLPNVGEGLSAEAARTLSETGRSEILSKYVRQALKSRWNRATTGQARVRVHTIGFFYESPDVGAFLWALARENEGSFVGMSKP